MAPGEHAAVTDGEGTFGRADTRRNADAVEQLERKGLVGRDDPHADLPGIVAHGSLGNLEFERATLFGVYEFLDRYVGVRFYFPGELGTVVPRTDAVAVPKDIDLMIAPAFTVRSFQMLGDGAVPGETNTVRWVPTSYGGDIPKDLQFQRQRWKIPQWLRLRLQTRRMRVLKPMRAIRPMKAPRPKMPRMPKTPKMPTTPAKRPRHKARL